MTASNPVATSPALSARLRILLAEDNAVNQKLALSSGAQPCSTIKLSVALAAVSEGLIDKDTEVALSRRDVDHARRRLAEKRGGDRRRGRGLACCATLEQLRETTLARLRRRQQAIETRGDDRDAHLIADVEAGGAGEVGGDVGAVVVLPPPSREVRP